MAKQPAQFILHFDQPAPRANVGGFYWPFVGGTFDRIDISVGAPNANGPTVFDVLVGGASIFADPDDRPTIPAGETLASVVGLAVPGAFGARVTYDLVAVPAGGVAGPCMLQATLDDGVLGVTDAVLPLETFVAAYFDGILGRPPSAGELAADLFDLTNGCLGLTFADTARGKLNGLFTGAEFLALATTDEEFVTALYWGYFNRPPDDDGLAFHLDELNPAIGNRPRNDVRADFAAHREFVNRAALYCRNQLPLADAVLIGGADPAAYVDGRADARVVAAAGYIDGRADARILVASGGVSIAEYVRDTIGAAFLDSADLDYTPNDAADTMTAVLTATGVGPATYGDATHIPTITVDSKGRVTAANSVGISTGGQASYGPDAVPGAPHALDEEFNSNVLNASWAKTLVNSTVGGVAPANDQNNTIPSHLYAKFTLAGQQLGLRANTPSASGDWSLSAKVSAGLRETNAGITIEVDDAAFQNAVRAYWQIFGAGSVAVGLDSQTSGSWSFWTVAQREALPSLTLTGLVLHIQRVANVWSCWYSTDGGRSFQRANNSTLAKNFVTSTVALNFTQSNQAMPQIVTCDWIRCNWRTF